MPLMNSIQSSWTQFERIGCATLRLEMGTISNRISSRSFFPLFEEANFKLISAIVPPCVKRRCKEEGEPKEGYMFCAKEGPNGQFEDA